MSHPPCQDWRITKTNDYDDQRTNGTGARQSKGLQFGETAATPPEPGELVVSADARSRGSRRGLATRPPCPSGADLFSGIILWQPRKPALGMRSRGMRPGLGCHSLNVASLRRRGQRTALSLAALEGNHRAPVIAPQQHNRRARIHV